MPSPHVTAGGSGVFRGDGSSIQTAATTGAAYSGFGSFASVTTNGGVSFAATLTAGGQGIFTGADPIVNHVIRTGDMLSGSTVTSVAYYMGAMNDTGQIAFVVMLADGRQGVYIATPVPEPAHLLALAGVVGSVGVWRRRQRAANSHRC